MSDGGRGGGERGASHWLEAMLEGRELEGEIKAGKVTTQLLLFFMNTQVSQPTATLGDLWGFNA